MTTGTSRGMTRSVLMLLPLLAAGPLLPGVARAELPERKSPLADAPAVRHRQELRRLRFEIGPGAATTIGQDFYHAVMVGGKLNFFLADWLAIGGYAAHNLTRGFKTSFHERLEAVLPPPVRAMDRAPTQEEARNGMNQIGQIFAAQAELVPFSGKYSLFGKIFASYDFYAFGGPGFVNFVSSREACATPANSCPVTGLKIGGNFGIGMRSYFNNFFSLDVEIRDLLLRNNPAGRDETGDRVADDNDLTWDSTYMVGINLTFFLPPRAPVSE
jgi:hypothetical protein